MKKKQFLPLFTAGFICFYHTIGSTEPIATNADVTTNTALTTIEMTNEVLVRDTSPLGINLAGDSFYGPAVMLKVRDAENFEGTSYRQAHMGTLFEDGFASCWAGLPWYEENGWAELMRNGGQYTLISGPAKWNTGTIAAVSSRTIQCWGKEKEALFFAFDREFSLPNQTPISNMGLLVENFDLVKHGHIGKQGSYWAPSENCSLLEGDTPSESFGYASLVMDGTSEPATVRLSAHKQKYANLNGPWKYSFWTKLKQGTPQVTLSFGKYVEKQEIGILANAESTELTLASEWFTEELNSFLFGEEPSGSLLLEEEFTLVLEAEERPEFEFFEEKVIQTLEIQNSQWQKYELTFQIDDVPEFTSTGGSPSVFFLLTVQEGIIVVDDLEVKMEGDKNPTAFRDEIIAALKRYNPGVIRKLQVGGNTVRNTIMPRLKSHRGTNSFYQKVGINNSSSLKPYGLHDFYELSEYINAEPWFSLPGTMTKEEMEQFMEYLGAPVDVGWGKLRTELGHPQPWTETLKQIHIEIGNEAWNTFGGFKGGGFNGQDYWHDLFATAKNSPYYRNNIILHAAGQNYSSWMSSNILENTPNADRYAIAPYQLHTLNQQDVNIFNNDAELFSWLFARSLYELDNKMQGHKEVMDDTGVEFSIYEVNYHTLKGDVEHEMRNRIVASLGAGLNISNYMLQQLKKYGIRTQAFFNFSQFSFNMAHYGYDDFLVRLWGGGLNFRQDRERFRPTWLANELINKVLGGNLLKTIHTGANPTYAVTGSFRYNQAPETKEGFPEILSYGFAQGKKRSLIIYNLSTTNPHQVVIKFDQSNESVKTTAKSWLLTADSIVSNNEPENALPQVQMTEATIEGFQSGIEITLPQHSLQAISWSTASLLVELSNFEAVAETNAIHLSWQTASEMNNAGFYIWRAIEDSQSEYTNITKLGKLTSSVQADCLKGKLIATTGSNQLISAVGDSRTGACYSFKDTPSNGTYYYVLESIDTYGKRTFHCDALDAVIVGQGHSTTHLEAAKNYCKQETGG